MIAQIQSPWFLVALVCVAVLAYSLGYQSAKNDYKNSVRSAKRLASDLISKHFLVYVDSSDDQEYINYYIGPKPDEGKLHWTQQECEKYGIICSFPKSEWMNKDNEELLLELIGSLFSFESITLREDRRKSENQERFDSSLNGKVEFTMNTKDKGVIAVCSFPGILIGDNMYANREAELRILNNKQNGYD